MKLQITGMKMWRHLDCTCSVVCVNGVWKWRTQKIMGAGVDNGIASSEEDAIKLAERASAKLSKRG